MNARMPAKSSRRPYRVALVGCGAIAESGHLPSLLQHCRFNLAAVCDIRADRAALLARKAGGIETHTDHRALLDRDDLDAVILALHPEHSIGVAIEFLRAGKPVLDEKPLATRMADGLRLQRAIRQTRVVYQLGFVFRYCNLVRRMKEIAREIGTPALYRVGVYDERLDRTNPTHLAYIQQIFRHSSGVTHEGSHVVDFFGCWNSSPFTHIHATAMKTSRDFKGPNLWNASLQTADGSTLQMEVGWLLPDLPPCELSIAGPNGTVQLRLFEGRGEWRRRGRVEKLRVEPMKQDWARQLDAFASAMDRGRPVGATVEDGLRVLEATQACEESARTGKTVRLK